MKIVKITKRQKNKVKRGLGQNPEKHQYLKDKQKGKAHNETKKERQSGSSAILDKKGLQEERNRLVTSVTEWEIDVRVKEFPLNTVTRSSLIW